MPNYYILFFSILFGFTETAYFGWNLTPQSDPELIADGITILIGSLAFIHRRA